MTPVMPGPVEARCPCGYVATGRGRHPDTTAEWRCVVEQLLAPHQPLCPEAQGTLAFARKAQIRCEAQHPRRGKYRVHLRRCGRNAGYVLPAGERYCVKCAQQVGLGGVRLLTVADCLDIFEDRLQESIVSGRESRAQARACIQEREAAGEEVHVAMRRRLAALERGDRTHLRRTRQWIKRAKAAKVDA